MKIEKLPGVRLVFDRKHVATKDHKGLVQIEITCKMKRKWVSTDVKLYSDQWDDRKHVIRSTDAIEQNEWLNKKVTELEMWLRENVPFSWEKLDSYLKNSNKKSDSFLDFMEKTIEERNDIREGTKKLQRPLVKILEKFGKIRYFSDITKANIIDFDNWLHGRKSRKFVDGAETLVPISQHTVSQYQKILCSYINIAIHKGYLEYNPYSQFKVKRGESEPGRYLSNDELQRLINAPMPRKAQDKARDAFVFQCYTGLAYADLRNFDFTKAKDCGGDYLYSGKRVKTGEQFCFIILPKAMEILKKYNYKLPLTTVLNYDDQLKKVAASAGIDKPIASHWARRTAAMQFLNKGIRLEVVAKILGHSSVSTTEKFYASIRSETVLDEMKKAGF